MSYCLKRPSEFSGIGIEFDFVAQPFFEIMVLEALRQIKQSDTAKLLFKRIAAAKPSSVPNDWPRLVNVKITPPMEKTMSAPGLKRTYTDEGEKSMMIGDQAAFDGWYTGKKGKLLPSMGSKTAADDLSDKEAKEKADGSPGGGCIAVLYFSNIEILSKDGTWLPAHITMGHELIHCLHYLEGKQKQDYKAEEHFTVGIKGYESTDITENKLRQELGFPARKKYFADD